MVVSRIHVSFLIFKSKQAMKQVSLLGIRDVNERMRAHEG